MSHLWHAAEIVPVDDHIPLDLRSMDELKKIRDDKALLFQHLEEELFWLKQPTDLEKRVAMLEGVIAVAEYGDQIDPEERSIFLRKFVEDLRDDHHHFAALDDQGAQAEKLPHGVHLQVAEHPALTEGRAQAEHEEYIRKHPSTQEPHPDIGRPGYFTEHYKLKKNPYTEQGWDYTQEVAGETVWHEYQEDLDALEEFDNRVAESRVGKIAACAANKISDNTPQFFKEVQKAIVPEAEAPLQYGCGDVFIDKDAAKSTGRAVRWQMAEVGLPVYGDAPPVTKEWLEENEVLKASEEEKKDEEKEEEEPAEVPETRRINIGSFDPKKLAASGFMQSTAPPMSMQMMRPPASMASMPPGMPPATMASMPMMRPPPTVPIASGLYGV